MSERHNLCGTKRTTKAARGSRNTSPEEEQGTRSRSRSMTESASTSDFSYATDSNTNSGSNVSQGADIFPFDDPMNFGDSLNTFTMPDVASTLVSTIPPSESQDTIEALLQHFGCDKLEPPLVESNSARLDTPLHMAVRGGSAKIVQLLLQHGADCNTRGAQSMTPLAHAIIGNHESVADMLLSRGAQVLAIDDQQRSALHLAVMHRRERLLRTLVCRCERNSGVLDECDMEGKTPLHIAISMDLDSAVEVLCEGGANVHLQPGVRSTLAA